MLTLASNFVDKSVHVEHPELIRVPKVHAFQKLDYFVEFLQVVFVNAILTDHILAIDAKKL